MTTNKEVKPRPIFRLLFFLVGLCFQYDIYLGIKTGRADGPGRYFRYFILDPGLGYFFCRYMAWGSNWWRHLPRWMMK